MAILHLRPGDIVPRSGVYALRAYPGGGTTYSVWRDKGERLPPVATCSRMRGTAWFVLVHEARRNSQVR